MEPVILKRKAKKEELRVKRFDYEYIVEEVAEYRKANSGKVVKMVLDLESGRLPPAEYQNYGLEEVDAKHICLAVEVIRGRLLVPYINAVLKLYLKDSDVIKAFVCAIRENKIFTEDNTTKMITRLSKDFVILDPKESTNEKDAKST